MMHEHKTVLPEMKEWQILVWPIQPGYYFTSDLENACRKLLDSGRSPKVALW
jgi:hypothetical protein